MLTDYGDENETQPVRRRSCTAYPVISDVITSTSPEEVDAMFDGIAAMDAPLERISLLFNLAGRQVYTVSDNQLQLLMDVLAKAPEFPAEAEKTLALVREILSFGVPRVCKFMCASENIQLLWSFFPRRAAVDCLNVCMDFDNGTRGSIIGIIGRNIDTIMVQVTETAVAFLMSLFEKTDVPEMVAFVQRVVVMLTDSEMSEVVGCEGLTGLANKLIPAFPAVAELVIPALPAIVAANRQGNDEDSSLLELLKAVAVASNGYAFMQHPLIAEFVMTSLRSSDGQDGLFFFIIDVLAAAEDVTWLVNIELISAIVNACAGNTSVREKEMCVKFLGRVVAFQSAEQNIALFSSVPVVFVLDWIEIAESSSTDEVAVIVLRALTALRHIATSGRANYDVVFDDDRLYLFLETFSQKGEIASHLATVLLEAI